MLPSTKTTRVHCKREPFDVYCGRPGKYGNPYRIGTDGTRAEVIEKFRQFLRTNPDLVKRAKRELRGKVLGCWCGDHEPCHCDVWIEAVEAD